MLMSENKTKKYEGLMNELDLLGLKDKKAAIKRAKEIAEIAEAEKENGFQLLFEGEAYFYSDEYHKALDATRKAKDLLSTNSFVISIFASLLANTEQPGEAGEQFKLALSFDPNNVHAITGIGNLLLDDGKPEEALEYFNQALSINPQYLHALFQKGVSLNNLYKHEEALEVYNSYLDKDPDSVRALSHKGFTIAELGFIQESIEYLDKALAIDPKSTVALRNMGIALIGLERFDEAIEYIEKALNINSEDAKLQSYKGVALAQLGRIDEALGYHNKALSIAPKNSNIICNKGIALHSGNRFSEAIDLYDEALSIDPKNINVLVNKATALSEIGNLTEALQILNQILGIAPTNNRALVNKGVILRKLGDKEGAMNLYNESLSINPDNPHVLRNKGVLLADLGNYNDALEYYEKAIKLSPNDLSTLSNKASSLTALGRDEEALRIFDKVLSKDPKHIHALNQKGFAFGKMRKYEEAIACFNKVLSIKSNDFIALRNKGAALNRQGKYAESTSYFIKSRELKDWDEDDYLWIVNNFSNLKNIDEAILHAKEWLNFLQRSNKPEQHASFVLSQLEIQKGTKEAPPQNEADLNEFLNLFIDGFEEKNNIKEILVNIEARERELHTRIDTTQRSRKLSSSSENFLSVLRRWNSFTPIISTSSEESIGGGYFLFLNGKGIVIDPGFDFLRNFFRESFLLGDIDYIFITHAHIDHIADLEGILSLLYQANKIIDERNKQNKDGNIIPIKTIELFVNLGTIKKLSGWLNLMDTYFERVHVLEEGLEFKLGNIKVLPTRAKHHEIIDNQYSLGIVFEYNGIKIGFTGDTGWDLGDSIATPFNDCKYIVAHLGSILNQEFSEVDLEKRLYKYHLGLLGMSLLLHEVKPGLCIISEFGEEIKDYRVAIAEGIEVALNIQCLSADVGTEIELTADKNGTYKVRCAVCGNFSDLLNIKPEEYHSLILYTCRSCKAETNYSSRINKYQEGARWELWDK